jgi:F0F1-type ATP synthase assembly protein I
MKLLPSPAFARRSIRADDAVGRGMDAAFTMLTFIGIGFAVDQWLGTTPVLMIALSVLAAVGLFFSWKARYMTKMEELEAQRRQDTAP